MQFSKRLELFGDEIFAALNNKRIQLEQQGKKIYNMSVGTPDFHTPDYIKETLIEAAKEDSSWRYSLGICRNFLMLSVLIIRSVFR